MYCDNFEITLAPSPVTTTVNCDLFFGLEFLDVTVKDPQDNEDTISATFESGACEDGACPGSFGCQ
jgi:hypothetical protein